MKCVKLGGLPAAFFFALLLAGCADRAPDPRGVDHDETLLTVAATGRAENRPDEARFTAGVQTIRDSARAANEANAQAMEKLVAALEAEGVAEKDIRTQTISVNRIGYGKQEGRFEANNSVEVRVRAIDKASDVVGAATGAGANLLSGPDLRLSDPEAASMSAYTNAYQAARARAQAYAGAAGLEIARVLAIRDGALQDGPIPYAPPPVARPVSPQMEQSAAPPVRPGTTTSTVTVSVDFALAKGE
ncbi:SIMPL domain-containing protein [Novosphingopyxis sp.]|uniref:SIMPL domain-containing protein n=1 Tax=Novosphingopyxis sp. TaxID=2709690 RepID=UPI003B5B8967